MTDFDRLEKETKSSGNGGSKAPAWKPTEGDVLRGYVRGVDYPYVPAASEHRYVMTVEDENGEFVAVWLSQTVLKNRIMDAAPAKDTPIVIIYEGKLPTKDGNRTYNAYSVNCIDSDFQWWLDVRNEAMQKDELRNYEGKTGGGVPAGFTPPEEAPF